MKKFRLVLACLVLSMLLLFGGAGAATYTIKILPDPPGCKDVRGPNAINEKGQIVGTASDADGNEHAVVWDLKGGVRWLSELPGHTDSWGIDINDAGQVVGWSCDASRRDRRAVLWGADGKPLDLGTLGGGFAEASAICNKGHVVGFSYVKEGFKAHAFLWTPKRGIVDLGSLAGGTSSAEDLNDAGRIVGCSTDADGKSHAVIWEPDGTMKDLGPVLGLSKSSALCINNKGRIAGKEGVRCGDGNAFVWDAQRGLRDLGRLEGLPRFVGFIDPPPVPSSAPAAINDSGQVVGDSTGKMTMPHAFFWSAGTGMIDLGTLPREKPETDERKTIPGMEKLFEGHSSSSASDISNDSTIVGTSNGHPVIWIPSK